MGCSSKISKRDRTNDLTHLNVYTHLLGIWYGFKEYFVWKEHCRTLICAHSPPPPIAVLTPLVAQILTIPSTSWMPDVSWPHQGLAQTPGVQGSGHWPGPHAACASSQWLATWWRPWIFDPSLPRGLSPQSQPSIETKGGRTINAFSQSNIPCPVQLSPTPWIC